MNNSKVYIVSCSTSAFSQSFLSLDEAFAEAPKIAKEHGWDHYTITSK